MNIQSSGERSDAAVSVRCATTRASRLDLWNRASELRRGGRSRRPTCRRPAAQRPRTWGPAGPCYAQRSGAVRDAVGRPRDGRLAVVRWWLGRDQVGPSHPPRAYGSLCTNLLMINDGAVTALIAGQRLRPCRRSLAIGRSSDGSLVPAPPRFFVPDSAAGVRPGVLRPGDAARHGPFL
jgi:hypothetical protein